MQYFYIVVYTIVGDDMTMCKIGLNPHQLIEWGRREATKHPERSYNTLVKLHSINNLNHMQLK